MGWALGVQKLRGERSFCWRRACSRRRGTVRRLEKKRRVLPPARGRARSKAAAGGGNGDWTRAAFRRFLMDAKAYLSSTHWVAGGWQFVRSNGTEQIARHQRGRETIDS